MLTFNEILRAVNFLSTVEKWQLVRHILTTLEHEQSLRSLSTVRMDYKLQTEGGRLNLARFEAGGHSWADLSTPPSDLFAVHADGQRFSVDNLRLVFMRQDPKEDSTPLHAVASFEALVPALRIDHHMLVYPYSALIECWQTIVNIGSVPCRISRLDSFVLNIPAGAYDVQYFSSDWGQEFEPVRTPLSADSGPLTLETRFGRSSKGQHPWFCLSRTDGGLLSGSVVWSGNWMFRFEPLPDGGYRLSGGLSDWNFYKDLQPFESMVSPRVALALGDSLDDIAQQYAGVGRRYWYPRNALSEALPVEWNHWWSYEDKDINEDVFRRNVDAAARLGIELCTLDAGWFGQNDAGSAWYEQRGDWDRVNTERFPSGIRALADYTHARGMKFGLWCEIEALGIKARLAEQRPELAALRDGLPLGYVCFGNPAAQEWAFQTLSHLITEYQCDWLKLDFNLEPGAGCNRLDHGHGGGDGLYEHYRGYYAMLDRLRETFPDVVLENCSSGGLRIDLGMLRHTHLTFLSDPDWPAHHLHVLWGATSMLAPNACLHWSFSEWCSPNPPPQQTFNPHDPALKPHQFDYHTWMAMLSACGFSQKLPDLPDWVAERMARHIRLYKERIRHFVREGTLYRLTEQPNRSGTGERWCAFQYSLAEAEHLLAVFRLPGAEPVRAIRLQGLAPDTRYRLMWHDGQTREADGAALMRDGLTFADLREEEAALVWLESVHADGE